MESIAVIQANMGVLSQDRLLLTPFGTLAQTFAEEILARAQREEGRWSYVPLDLLEEGEESPQSAPAPVIQVDLKLVLEALRREKGESEQRRAAERIVERVLQIREVRQEQRRERPQAARRQETAVPPPGAVQQQFFQTLYQENRFGPTFLTLEGGTQGAGGLRRELSAPGRLGQRSVAFTQKLRQLREQGEAVSPAGWTGGEKPARLERGQIHPIGPGGPGPERPQVQPAALRQGAAGAPPPELAHREETGAQTGQTSRVPLASEQLVEHLARQGLEQLRRELTGAEKAQAGREDRRASERLLREARGEAAPSGGPGEKTGARRSSGKPDAAPVKPEGRAGRTETAPAQTGAVPGGAAVSREQGVSAPSGRAVRPGPGEAEHTGSTPAGTEEDPGPISGKPGGGDAAPAVSGQEVRENAPGGERQTQDRFGTVPPMETAARDPRVGRAEAEKLTPARRAEGAEPGSLEGMPGWAPEPELAYRTQEPEPGAAVPGAGAVPAGQTAGLPAGQQPEEHRLRTVSPLETTARELRSGGIEGEHLLQARGSGRAEPEGTPEIPGWAPGPELAHRTEDGTEDGRPEAERDGAGARKRREKVPGEQEQPRTGLKAGQKDRDAGGPAAQMQTARQTPGSVRGQDTAAEHPRLSVAQDIRVLPDQRGAEGKPLLETPTAAGGPDRPRPSPRGEAAAGPVSGTELVHLRREEDQGGGQEARPAGAAAARGAEGERSPHARPRETEGRTAHREGRRSSVEAETAAQTAQTREEGPHPVSPARGEQTAPGQESPIRGEFLGTARDIRVSQDLPPASGIQTAAGGQTAPVQPQPRTPSGETGLPGEGFAQGPVPGVELAHRTQEENGPGGHPAAEGRQAPRTDKNRAGAERKTAASGGAPAEGRGISQDTREGSAFPHAVQTAQTAPASGGKEGGQGRSSVRPLTLTARELPTASSGGLRTVQPLTFDGEDRERDVLQTGRAFGRDAAGEALSCGPQQGAREENARAAQGGRGQAAGMPPLPAGPELTYGPAAGQAEPEQGRSAAPVPQAVPQTGEGGRSEARAGANGRTAAHRPAGVAQAEALRRQAREGAGRRSGSADSGAGAPLGPRAIQLIHPLGAAPMAPVRRDIRTTERMVSGAVRPAAEPAGEAALAGQLPTLELTARPVQGGDTQTGEAVRPAADGGARGSEAAGPVLRGWAARGPEPVELTYSSADPASEAAAGKPERAPAESEYVQKLPDWARRFLRSGAAGEGQTMGSARNIATLPPPAGEETVRWQAPNYRPPAAPITYREKGREEPERAAASRISEAELQRTADRVYRMIEDRIRRERRRLGL